jgi:hypothetical protein
LLHGFMLEEIATKLGVVANRPGQNRVTWTHRKLAPSKRALPAR